MWKRPLFTISILLLIYSAISTVIAILNKLPYEFGGTGNPNTVAADSLTHGTTISPPLIALVILAVFTTLTLRRGWLGVVGVVGVTLFALLFLIAGLGEPIIWRTLRAGRFGIVEIVLLALTGAGFMLSLWMLFFSARELINRRQAQGQMLS